MSRYFNNYERNKIMEVVKVNPLRARTLYEEYLKKYPKDYGMYLDYARLLVILNEKELANKVFEYVEYLVSNNASYRKSKVYGCYLKYKYDYEVVKLLSEYKYQEIYDLYVNNDLKMLPSSDSTYLMKRLNLPINIPRGKYGYTVSQIVEYREVDFYKHIEKHLTSLDGMGAYFNNDFSCKEVIEEAKKYIPSNNKGISFNIYCEIYYFKYDFCGKVDKKTVNYFKVVSIRDTNNLLTIYPVDVDCEKNNMNYVDLNYLRKEEVVTKKLSQIDKFNRRYGIK